MRIVGVSFDSPADNAAWAKDKGFRFELWSDAGRELALHWGAADAPDQARAKRTTVLLDAEGRVVVRYTPGLDLGTHPADVLDDARKLFGP